MGLLDIWNDWRKESGYGRDDLTTAGGSNEQSLQRKYKRGQFPPTDPKYIRDKKEITTPRRRVIKQEGTPINAPGHVGHPMMNKEFPRKTPNLVPTDPITQGGVGVKQAEDFSFMQRLANMANVDMDKAMASWKDKGGFEGLMANPAFTMGLAFMQAGAEGKTLGQGALDNVMKAAGISSHYKKIIEGRKQEPIQVTAADIDEVKEHLKRFKIDAPNMWEKVGSWFKGEDGQANYDRAAESIAIEYQKEVARLQKANKTGKPLVIDSAFKEKIIKKVIESGKIKRKKGWFGPLTAGTIEEKSVFKARGGPVQAGKPYVVGEEGPEIIIPSSNGNVLSNDDSQIYAMLLAANPQLQKVSKARAERILRSRFPEYFE
jgi:hypothetical protein